MLYYLAMNLVFPEELPISQHRIEIEKSMRNNQVVIICGDTGSGKTTQLPKMALEIGRAKDGRRIACTQPRRLAAVTVARRVAEEFGEEVGQTIGFKHRFDQRLSNDTRIKFMTDGILLAETRRDPYLRQYDTIIVDEAHERSLNIDFLLGILKRILKKRKDLKVIVSSATLDANLFSGFFSNAPTLSIPGRLFPITTQYLPPADKEESDLARDVVRAVDRLPNEGDILVFLPGERDIRECSEALSGRSYADDEIIPLIATLPQAEQQKAFRLSAKRRIILSTNVAETSVTIPGIRYVVDSGLARLSRYIHRTQIQRLHIEPISQASANQRAGRCGRLGPGICIRLYSEEDFQRREKYTAPEILRSSLAGVILTMLDLGLGDITEFPFISPPENAMIREGIRELTELGALTIDSDGLPRLSEIGRKLAKMPVEPRIGRMVLAGDKEAALPLVLPIAAFMSCEDPRRRPVEEKAKADQAHAKFKSPTSDFAAILKLWQWWQGETKGLSQNKTRKLATANYLSYTKMREWQELTEQLTTLAKNLKLNLNGDTGGDDGLHRALLAGLLSRIGIYDSENRDYRGARGIRFMPFPGSALYKNPPKWIMAGELIDTSRLFARDGAVLNPEWIEPIAGDLCKHSYSHPEWDATSGFVRASEQVTLYGLVIVESRRCDFSRVDPIMSRDIFIRRGIIDGTITNPPQIVRRNGAIITELKERAGKLRAQEPFDEDSLVAFFDGAMPKRICSSGALRKWLYKASQSELEAFRLKASDWLPSIDETKGDFPDAIVIDGVRMKLSYKHSLDDEDDGITCTVNQSGIHALKEWRSDWLVPGAIREKLSWMISCLPSAQRRILSPLEDVVSRLMTYLHPGELPLNEALSKAFYDHWGLRILPEAWDKIRMPTHFTVRYRVLDDKTKRLIAAGRNLDEVLSKAAVPKKQSGSQPEKKQSNDAKKHTQWDFGDLTPTIITGEAGWQIKQYSALVDEGDGVTLHTYTDPNKAETTHQGGVTRLFVLAMGAKAKSTIRFRQWPLQAAYYLKKIGYDENKITSDMLYAIASETFVRNQAPIYKQSEYLSRLNSLNPSEARAELLTLIFDIITTAADRFQQLETNQKLQQETKDSIKNQLDWLIFPGFIRTIPLQRLHHYHRYLEAIRIRIERAQLSPSADMRRETEASAYWMRYRDLVASGNLRHINIPALVEYRWMIEEYRVSLFAQELRTPTPISPKRLELKWDEATKPKK